MNTLILFRLMIVIVVSHVAPFIQIIASTVLLIDV
jgi:hypothetical protein